MRGFTALCALLFVLAGIAAPSAAASVAPQEDRLTAEQMAAATPVAASPRVGGPWSSPEPELFYSNQPDTAPDCGVGYVCMKIKAGSQPWYYDFWYYDYGTYALENWVGSGWMNNRQTGGATLRTYNASGGRIECFESHPDFSFSRPNWSPVYYIQLSPAGC